MSQEEFTPTPKPESPHGETLHTIRMRAGRRTYYFDVKCDRKGEQYLTITESRPRLSPDGTPAGFDKQKLFVYAEDMQPFVAAIMQAATAMQTPSDTPILPCSADSASTASGSLSNINIDLNDIEF